MMGDLLIFDSPISLWEYMPIQPELFPAYMVDAGETGLITNEFQHEWVVLIGNAFLVVDKSSNDIRVLNAV